MTGHGMDGFVFTGNAHPATDGTHRRVDDGMVDDANHAVDVVYEKAQVGI